MAHTATHAVNHRSLGAILSAPFIAVGRFMITLAEANSRYKQAQFLHSLTDEQLAERGIKREDIIREVYSHVLYV